MSRKKIYSAGELSRRITCKLTLANLGVMLVLFTLCVAALNVFTYNSMNQRVDAELERQLQGFTKSHLSAEEHSQRLPSGLLPIIYFYSDVSGYINPHPSSLIIDADMDTILARNLPEGYSTQTTDGRTYRVYRVFNDPAITFWEQGSSFSVSETVSFQDITSEKAMVDSLRAISVASVIISAFLFAVFGYLLARKSLAPINRAWNNQRQLAADTSHALRNPTAVVQANAELLLRHPYNTIEKESEHVAAILDSSNKMATMLATLLTLARADANEDEMVYERICLSDVLTKACAQFELISENRSIAFTADIPSSLFVLGDGERLEELFSILLDNAVRYTNPKGVVRVTCFQEREAIVVAIEDSGIGMSAKDVNSVFQRFYRSGHARVVNPDGTGLGLPIAQWIVERHDAEIHIESKEGKGTRITLAFPFCP